MECSLGLGSGLGLGLVGDQSGVQLMTLVSKMVEKRVTNRTAIGFRVESNTLPIEIRVKVKVTK